MVEIVLHRVPGAVVVLKSLKDVSRGRTPKSCELHDPIFNAIPDGGITPEALFDVVMAQAPEAIVGLLPHQFFLAIVALLDGGFISTEVRQLSCA